MVGGGTIKPMECKVIAVKEFQQPQSKKDVRAFLGLRGYYQNFIKQFSTIAMPLTELKWDSRCEKAFSMLKNLLTQTLILSTPDWSKPFILQTDASTVGLGYVLSQINELGEEHPIAFASKKLSPPGHNYSIIECETLAIVKGIKHFRTYLQGVPFKLQTDHNLLIYLSNLKDSYGRLARWALTLQMYNFTIEHRSSKTNTSADGLSREPESATKVGGVSEPQEEDQS